MQFASLSLFFTLFAYAASVACPKGFTLINSQKCLKIVTTKEKHLEAELECSNYGATLVTVKTAIDNRAVTNMAASAGVSTVWLGLYCYASGNSTVCYHDDNAGPVIYNSFASGNPKLSINGGCVYMSVTGKTAGQWMSIACETSGMPYICEVPPTVADSTCTRNYNGYCYTASHEMANTDKVATYTKAQGFCQAAGGNLVSIHSKTEIDYIRAIYRNSGISDIFIGAQSSDTKTFKWTDASKWDYEYSDPLSTTTGNCLLMDMYPNMANNGLWAQTDCQNAFAFLCKRKISSAADSLPKPVHTYIDSPTQLDFSNCNTTLYMAPGLITSYGYPTTKPPVAYCSWTIVSLGPYRVGIYFTDFSTYSAVTIYDEFGGVINSPSGNQTPFYGLAPTNYMKISHNSKNDAAKGFHGFSATVLPY